MLMGLFGVELGPPLLLFEAELALAVLGPDLESKRRMVSRTLDFLPDPSTWGAMGGLVATGDSPDLLLPLALLCLPFVLVLATYRCFSFRLRATTNAAQATIDRKAEL